MGYGCRSVNGTVPLRMQKHFVLIAVLGQKGKTFVSSMMGCWRFFDPKILGAVAAWQQTFYSGPRC